MQSQLFELGKWEMFEAKTPLYQLGLIVVSGKLGVVFLFKKR
jgi:hypothetical protein